MSTIGVILVGRNMQEYVEPCLASWLTVAHALEAQGHKLLICAVSVPFVGFPHEAPDNTVAVLQAARDRGDIDHFITSETAMTETDARGAALTWLLSYGATLSWQLDLDEVYSPDDITNALAFVEANPFISWFRLSLRNAVFNEHTFLVEPFAPPRIHRLHLGGYRAVGFWDDNNVRYGGTITRDLKRDLDFASMTVPATLCNPRHLTWLNNDRSRRKIEYQLQGRGWPECSFRWDGTTGLRFNEAYYAVRGLGLPEIAGE